MNFKKNIAITIRLITAISNSAEGSLDDDCFLEFLRIKNDFLNKQLLGLIDNYISLLSKSTRFEFDQNKCRLIGMTKKDIINKLNVYREKFSSDYYLYKILQSVENDY